jgi:uncharacterized membrane protein
MLHLFILGSIVLLLVDSLYLTMTRDYFALQVLEIQKSTLRLDLLASAFTYFIMAIGFYYFILRENKGVMDAFLLGLVIYMTFDGTNKAIFTNWKWKTLLLDGLWGGILFAISTYIVKFIIQNNKQY